MDREIDIEHNIQNSTGADAGALRDKSSKEQDKFADEYYESIRNRKIATDIAVIAENSGFSQEDIMAIRNHMFIEKHDLGDGRFERFDSSWLQAQAWQRMERNWKTSGDERYRDVDVLMLHHELEELTIMKRRGVNYHIAHDETNEKYNWWLAIKELEGL
jgi:hypothetical protein